MVYINGIMQNGIAVEFNSPLPTDFSAAADKIKIGGEFDGQLRRFQIFTPAAFGLASSNSINNIILGFSF